MHAIGTIFLSLCNETLLYFCSRTHHVGIVCFIKRRVIWEGFLVLHFFFKLLLFWCVYCCKKTSRQTNILKLRLEFRLKSGKVTDSTESSKLSFYMLFSLLICLVLYNIQCNAGIVQLQGLSKIDKTKKRETENEFFLMMKRNSSSNSSWK